MTSRMLLGLCLALTGTAGCLPGASTDRDEGLTGGLRRFGSLASVTNRSDATIVLVPSGADLGRGDVWVRCPSGSVTDLATSVDGAGNLVIQASPGAGSVAACQVSVVSDGIAHLTDDGGGPVVGEHRLIDVVGVTVKGNGSIHLAGVAADTLTVLVLGTGAVDIAGLETTTLDLELRGTGDARLSGDTVDCVLEISGNGSLAAIPLTVSNTLDAVMRGAGDGAITVLGVVNAEVHGPARLDVYGGATPGSIDEINGGLVAFH